MVKNLPTVQEAWVQSLGREDPLEKGMATHSQGQRSLAGYSPWGHTELDMTERLTLSLSLFINLLSICLRYNGFTRI